MLDESLFSHPVQFKARCYLDSHNLETIDTKLWPENRRHKSTWKKELSILLPNPEELDARWWGTNCTSTMWPHAEKLHPNSLVIWCYLLTKTMPYDCFMSELGNLVGCARFTYGLGKLKDARLVAYQSQTGTGLVIRSVSRTPMNPGYFRRRCLGLE